MRGLVPEVAVAKFALDNYSNSTTGAEWDDGMRWVQYEAKSERKRNLIIIMFMDSPKKKSSLLQH